MNQFKTFFDPTWEALTTSHDHNSVPQVLNNLGQQLSGWRNSIIPNAANWIKALQKNLIRLHNEIPLNYQHISRTKHNLLYFTNLEEERWKQKSRVLWLRHGDQNSKFFQAKMNQRRSMNKILLLQDHSGTIHTDHQGIQNCLENHFSNIFSGQFPPLQDPLPHLPSIISSSDNAFLTADISMEEVKAATFQIHPDKMPGPDGFTPGFYQKQWDKVGPFVLHFVQSTLSSGSIDPQINHTHLCLIPKTIPPTTPSQFRPISLCNVIYKILSKVLANRLKRVLPKAISPLQSAFLPGRSITDNVILAHELLHSLKTRKRKEPHLALKLDITKAFDKVNWEFLRYMLHKMGFSETWTKWILLCVTSVSYSIIVNGKTSRTINPSCGIRQGDPLSPYLYLICTEGLSYLLHQASQRKLITGFKAAPQAPQITHLLFADDSLVLCKANTQETLQLRDLLNTYESISGQAINYTKSVMTTGKNTDRLLKAQLASSLGIPHNRTIGFYLGLPEFTGRNFGACFQYLLDRINTKLNGWTNRMLNQAGKEILIKSIIQALPTYAMQCFMIPKTLTDKMEQLIRQFWWRSTKDKRPIPWIQWSKIAAPKCHGGLGFRNLNLFNKALIAKQTWRILTQPDLLVSKVLKAKYFRKTSLFDAPIKKNSSFAWRSIRQGIPLVQQNAGKQIGKGDDTDIWRDRWLPSNPPSAPRPINQILAPTVSKPSNLMLPHSRIWDTRKVQELIHPEDVIKVLQVRPSSTSTKDKFSWPLSSNGRFTVKTGYQLLYNHHHPHQSNPANHSSLLTKLCKKLWSLSIPPKLKNFWWKTMHNGLPTKTNLQSRLIPIEVSCKLCGEQPETIDHLLVHCRVTKEIWSSSVPEVNARTHNSVLDFTNHIWRNVTDGATPYSAFIGWSIWKSRNNLVFNNERQDIPDIVLKATEEYDLWLTHGRPPDVTNTRRNTQASRSEFINRVRATSPHCFVDASWISQDTQIGVAWTFHSASGTRLAQGLGAFPPTISSKDAEAQAILEACKKLHLMNLNGTTILSDAKVVIDAIKYSLQISQTRPSTCNSSDLQALSSCPFVEDICSIAQSMTPPLSFLFIPRSENTEIDKMAKEARQNVLPYTIRCN